jgi:diguanylate cyclase (GGDEF)-like protein/PAS domain S-box-containing protein
VYRNNSRDKEQASPRTAAYRRFKHRLVAGLLGISLLAVLVCAWEFRSSYTDKVSAGHTQTQNLARAVEAHVLYSIQFADVSLVTFSNALRLLPPEKRNSTPTVKALMSARSTVFADDFWNLYIGPDGKGIATSNKLMPLGASYLDRDYFQYHAQGRNKGLYVGGPVIGRISGRKVFFISRRIESDDGTFLGVIAAPIDAGRFAKVFEDSRFNNDVTIALLHRGGKVIARAPQFDDTFAVDMHDADVFKRLQTFNQGTFETVSAIDGRPHLYSFRALNGLPLVVAVGISNLAAAESLNQNVLIGGVGVLSMVVIMVLSAYFALRAYRAAEGRELRYRELYDSSRETELKLLESERRLRLITDTLPVLIGHIDCNERFIFANKTYEDMFDIAWSDIAHSTVAEVLGPETYKITKPYIDAALNGETVHFERPRTHHGKQHCDAVHYIPDKDANGVVHGFFLMVEDITGRKRAEESRLLAALVYDNTSEGMLILDTQGAVIDVNPAFTRLTGFALEEIAGKHLSTLASERHDKEFFQTIRSSIVKTGQWHGEIWNRHKNGESYLIAITFNTVCNERGEPFRRVALFSDITKKKASEELIWSQANFDPLTGLPNRRMFHERLRMEMKKTDRSHLQMALVFIDLDHFKDINDTLGHAQGDVLLKEAAQRLSASVRGTDTVARLGGDEFTVILSEVSNASDVARIGEDILRRLSEPFQLGDNQGHISASIGITLYPDDGSTVEVLLKNADQAMYAAKEQGRNRYNYFAPFMQEATQVRKLLTKELREAVANDQFRVVYQTIVELKTGEIQKAEALVRWQHPVRGMLAPSDFIGIAESTGMIVSIGDWVFRQAAHEVKRLQQFAGKGFQICVNKSAMQFRDGASQYQEWLDYLDQLGLSGNSIIVEVTEQLLQDASNQVTDKLLAFRDAGIQVSLDDFGTGYSSLSFLKRFDIDYLKINPRFVSNLTAGSDDVLLCEAIVVMAHKLGMKVIAEGIETEEQLDYLTRAGCDYGQGFLFTKPVRAEELEGLLQLRQATCG